MEKDEFNNDSSEADLSDLDAEGEGQDGYGSDDTGSGKLKKNDLYLTQKQQKRNNDLTQLQEDIIYAIETLNKAFFIDLGG